TLELGYTCPAAAGVQVYLDDGGGYRDTLQVQAALPAASEPAILLLPIPAGTYRSLRLDPPEGGRELTLRSARLRTRAGRTLAEIPLTGWRAGQQLAALAPALAGLNVRSLPGSDDPQLLHDFPVPVAVGLGWRDYAAELLPLQLPVLAALVALLFLLDRLAGPRARLAARVAGLAPSSRVALTAAVAVVASAYPVVFLGKSHVSPNLGTTLLYGEFPTLPGDRSTETTDVKLSDIGAVMWQHVPFSMMQRRALLEGELPLWNRYNAMGVPLLGQGQSMFGDPLHLLVVAADGAAWAWDVKYLLAKWLLALGLGLTVLALTRPGPTTAAVLVAAAAPFLGFFLYRLNHPAYFSVCYAPWPLYCLVRLALLDLARDGVAAYGHGARRWSLALLGTNLALMCSGTVKEAYMLLVSVNLAGAGVVLAGNGNLRSRLARLGSLAWYGVLFALLTAPVWGTFLGALANAYTGYNEASAYQLQPSLLLGLFDEAFYRPLLTKDQVFGPSLNFLLLLGLLYYLATLREQFSQPIAVALGAACLPPLALAFGLVPPAWIVNVPFLRNIAHLDNTFSCVLIVLGTVLAGLGFASAGRRLGTREGRADLAIAGLLLFALVFGWIAFRQASHRAIYGPTFSVHPPGQVLAINPLLWTYLASLLAAAGLLTYTARRAALTGWTSARALLAITCVLSLVWRHGLHASAVGFDDFTAQPTPRADFHARSPALEHLRAAHAREPGRVFGFQSHFFPGWTGVYGLEGVHGPDALVNPALRDLLGASGVERQWDWRLYAEAKHAGAVRPFLDALNVRHYVDRGGDPQALASHLTPELTADLDVYSSPTAWPRAFFSPEVVEYQGAPELVARIRASAGRPFAAVERSDAAAVAAVAKVARATGGASAEPARHYHLGPNSTTFLVRARQPGVVVLTEANWPRDFRATINGRAAPVIRVNHAFLGLVLDGPGEYRVTFRHWPRDLSRNLSLCLVGALLLAGTLWLGRRTPAPSPR
ncbi:MAG: hypothetical protein RLZZ447_1339, partial [Verrucomicrobiota bacterium]